MDGGEAETRSISYEDPSGNTCPRNLCLLQRDLQVGEDSHRSRQSSIWQRRKTAASSPKVGIPGTSPPRCNQETRYPRGSFVPRLAMPPEPSKTVSLWNQMKTWRFHVHLFCWAAWNQCPHHPTAFWLNQSLRSSPRKNRSKDSVL